MDATSFWMTWLGIWLTVFLSITGLLVAFACGDKQRIHDYIHGAPAPHPAAAAVEAARSIANFIFGDRLFYGWGFLTSVLFSFVAAATFFGIAWVKTPTLRAEHMVAGRIQLSTSNLMTVALTIASIMMEYLYVAKSRWLLAVIRDTFSTRQLLGVLIGDVASTLAAFLVATPLLLTATSMSFSLFFGSVSDPGVGIEVTTPDIWLYGQHLVRWAPDGRRAYPAITSALTTDVVYQITHFPSAPFQTLSVYRKTGEEECVEDRRGAPAKKSDHSRCTFMLQGVEYLTTTMLATAFATTLWVSFTAIMLILSRMLAQSILTARHFFLWLYDHPNIMIGCWVACWPVCIVSGEIIARLLFSKGG